MSILIFSSSPRSTLNKEFSTLKLKDGEPVLLFFITFDITNISFKSSENKLHNCFSSKKDNNINFRSILYSIKKAISIFVL